MSQVGDYDALSEVFSYPSASLATCLGAAQAAFGEQDAQLSAIFESVRANLGSLSETECEELFTRTFDINPLCTLEIGWHLFGEEYERGAFLVEMRQRMRALGVEENGELPDHLSSALRVAGRLDAEDADTFVRGFLLPALIKMLEGFGERENPYRAALEATRGWLERRHGPALERKLAGSVRPAPYTSAGGCGTSCSEPME